MKKMKKQRDKKVDKFKTSNQMNRIKFKILKFSKIIRIKNSSKTTEQLG